MLFELIHCILIDNCLSIVRCLKVPWQYVPLIKVNLIAERSLILLSLCVIARCWPPARCAEGHGNHPPGGFTKYRISWIRQPGILCFQKPKLRGCLYRAVPYIVGRFPKCLQRNFAWKNEKIEEISEISSSEVWNWNYVPFCLKPFSKFQTCMKNLI